MNTFRSLILHAWIKLRLHVEFLFFAGNKHYALIRPLNHGFELTCIPIKLSERRIMGIISRRIRSMMILIMVVLASIVQAKHPPKPSLYECFPPLSLFLLLCEQNLGCFGRLPGTVGSSFYTNVMNWIQECDLYKEPIFSYINKFPIFCHLYNFNFPTVCSFTVWTPMIWASSLYLTKCLNQSVSICLTKPLLFYCHLFFQMWCDDILFI